ncbi:MAG: class I SAM-dependent methyltransferase [Candidatus Sumerlaeota bacterium]|nr:class I SAM-dependent methyltransferase [Candidatus Sumerlaeota bacterium]
MENTKPAADPALQELEDRRRIWREKPQIRLVYERWIARMRPYLPAGPLLEVGSGSGLTKDLLPQAWICDIVPAPWLDLVTDGMKLPFANGALGGILAFDFLHHVADPHEFFDEAARTLRPGGRVLLIEPYITPVSFFGYKLLHHEDVYFGGYHKDIGPDGAKSDPWQGNLALPNLVFGRETAQWSRRQPSLRIIKKEKMSFLDFQLAAGFKPRAYVPHGFFRRAVRLDDFLGFLMPLIGFRIFVTLEKV